jgi:hypothetical protein
MRHLASERAALADALRRMGLQVVMFEDLGGRDEDAERAYLDGVARSDIYVGIVGDRYGTMLPSGRSPTHEEYREARMRGKRISVWVARDGANRQGDARDFVQAVQVFHTTGTFTDADDLARRVVERMAEIAADDEAPWVKVGDAVFRADRVRDEGAKVKIDASVRDERVGRYLEGLRPSAFGSEKVRVTTQDRSGEAKVEEVVAEMTSRSVRHLTITAEVEWPDGWGDSLAAGAAGLTADDLVERGLRAGLFGEALPQQLGMLEFMADTTDPLAGLRGEAVAEGSIEAIGRLLIVERLIGDRKASAVESLEIGPEHDGTRRVRLVYTEMRHATNVEPATRDIEGDWPSG